MRAALWSVTLAALVFAGGYYYGRSHGRDSRDLASKIEGHINYLVQVVQCQ